MKEKVLALAALTASLEGCTVIDGHERVPGWPALKVTEHYIPDAEMRARCTRYAPVLTLLQACTVFDLDRGEAHIFLSKDFHPSWIVEHERLHAAGYDHIGSRAMSRMWEAWKVRREQAFLTR